MSDLTYLEIAEEFEAVIAEMSGDANAAATLVRLDPEVVAAVIDGDDDPKFATYIIESGTSKNGRKWSPEIFKSVEEQINSSTDVVGYLGHIPESQQDHAFPPIQIHWLKSRLNVTSDKCQLYVKGYVLPSTVAGAVGRDYIKRGLAKTVSWQGKAAVRMAKGVQDVVEFSLKSIDIARPRAAGMKTALVGGLTSEMHEGGYEVKPDEIKALAQNELRAHNPELVAEIEKAATEPVEEKVTKLEKDVTEAKVETDLMAEIREALSVPDGGNVLEAIQALLARATKAGKAAKSRFLDEILERKFKDAATRTLVKRLVAAEMDSDTEIVSEMEAVTEDDEKLKETTEKVVNKIIDNDDDMKKMVSEMTGSAGATFKEGATNGDRSAEHKDGPGIKRRKVGSRR